MAFSSRPSPLFSVLSVLATSNLPPFFFALSIGIPSALLYCLELAVIITNFAHFNSAFFVLVSFRAVSSLVNFVFSFFVQRFGKIGLFLPLYLKLPRFVLALFLFFAYYSFHMENLLTIFLSVNRFTAILFPTKYQKLWRHGLPFVLGANFLLPLPLSLTIFNLDMYIHVQDDNVTFTLDNYKRGNEINLVEIASSSSCALGISCLLLNLASIFAYKVRKNGHQNSTIECKMTIYAVVTFFGHFIGTIFWTIVAFTSTNFMDAQGNRFSHAQAWFGLTLAENDLIFLANFNQFPWVNDLSTLAIPAWLMLWASTKMNEIIAKKIKRTRKNKKKANAAFVVPFSNKIHPFPHFMANQPNPK